MRSSTLTSLAHPHEGQRAIRLGGPSASAPKGLVSLVSPREERSGRGLGGGTHTWFLALPGSLSSLMLLLTLSCLFTVAWTTPSPNVSTHTPWQQDPGAGRVLLPPAPPSSLESATCGVFKSSLVPRRPWPGLAIELPGTEVRAGAAVFRPFPDKLYFYPVTFRAVSRACSRCPAMPSGEEVRAPLLAPAQPPPQCRGSRAS